MKKITLSLLATTILTTVSAQAYAAGTGKEPGIYFYPAKTWVVGHADNPTDCAVQSEFNNGFVLQFDGSSKAVKSFSVNFRQSIFSEGQNYDVLVSVPGKTSNKFSATATSDTMLTMPLRDQKSLYQAARDNAVIDVVVDDNSFRFFLVNFAPAAKNFENCMAGKPLNEAAPMPVSAPAPATTEHNIPTATTPVNAETLEAVPAAHAAAPAPQQRSFPAPVEQEPLRDASAAPQPLQRQEVAAIPQEISPPLAPPPPYGRDPQNAPAEAQNATARDMINESIALEEQEARGQNVAIREIVPEAPQAEIRETTAMNVPSKTSTDISQQPFRKRMSQQLAEEIAQNPSIASVEQEKPFAPPVKKNTSGLQMPPSNELVTPTSVDPIAYDTAPVRPIDQQRQAAIKPTVEELPRVATQEPQPILKPAPAVVAKAPAVVPMPAPEMEVKQETVALIQENPAPKSYAPNAPEGLAPHPSSMPFAQKREIIETNPQKQAAKEQAESNDMAFNQDIGKAAASEMTPIMDEAPAPEMMAEATTPAQAPVAQAATQKTVDNFKSSEIKINREQHTIEADFRDAPENSARNARIEPSSGGFREADPEMTQRLSELEKQVHELEKENIALNDELKSSLTGAQEEHASIASENWNLERATMRFTEAERQSKRLGEQLQRERAQCNSQKKDIEAQLFDPQITNQQQLAKLAELEQKLATADQQLQDQRVRYEERIKILQLQSTTQ